MKKEDVFRMSGKDLIFLPKKAPNKAENLRFRLCLVRVFITHCTPTRASYSTKAKAPTAQMRVEALDWCE